jgi:hypothetical protein
MLHERVTTARTKAACWPAALAATGALALLIGCKRAAPASRDAGCAADSARTLQLGRRKPCEGPEKWLCQATCRAGHAASCLGLAYAAERDSARPDAERLYARACTLGAALGCTNYAAHVWSRKHSADELACARRTFEKACAAREPYACGMAGRVMLESTERPAFIQARRYLEGACAEMGGFPCRVLAKHLESGKLGEYKPELIGALLKKACDGGDSGGCDEPATASETFR